MNKQISYKIVSLVFGILVICFTIGFYVYAVWQEPTAAPPGDNVPAPINVGGESQTKSGALGVSGVFRAWGGAAGSSDGLTVSNGNVGIGMTTPTAKLDVVGTVEIFGAWEDKNAGVVYQAPSDGFVIAIAQGANVLIEGLTDSNNPPTTRRVWENAVNQAPESVTMPVKKGNYWRINFSAATTYSRVSWLPLGQ